MSFISIPVRIEGGFYKNTAVGYLSLINNTPGSFPNGEDNTAFGYFSLNQNTTGEGNSAFGSNSLALNISGRFNVAIGERASYNNTTGQFNVSVGSTALTSSTNSDYNTAVGYGACGVLAGNAGSNTMIGAGAGAIMTTGAKNTIVGRFLGNQFGLDIRTLSNYIVLSDGDGNPRLWIDNTGAANIPGGISPSGAGNIITLQDIGTDPNEIPLNQYLGTMAFQDAAAVNLGIAEIDEIRIDKTITPGGTTGAQTIDKNAGSVNFAAAATSVVVTNSLVTTSSVIVATIATNDATMTSVQVVAAAGSFTIYANVAPTAETRVNFLVIN